jgi:hypothetical protein
MIFQLGEVDQRARKYNINVVFPIALVTGPSPEGDLYRDLQSKLLL